MSLCLDAESKETNETSGLFPNTLPRGQKRKKIPYSLLEAQFSILNLGVRPGRAEEDGYGHYLTGLYPLYTIDSPESSA